MRRVARSVTLAAKGMTGLGLSEAFGVRGQTSPSDHQPDMDPRPYLFASILAIGCVVRAVSAEPVLGQNAEAETDVALRYGLPDVDNGARGRVAFRFYVYYHFMPDSLDLAGLSAGLSWSIEAERDDEGWIRPGPRGPSWPRLRRSCASSRIRSSRSQWQRSSVSSPSRPPGRSRRSLGPAIRSPTRSAPGRRLDAGTSGGMRPMWSRRARRSSSPARGLTMVLMSIRFHFANA